MTSSGLRRVQGRRQRDQSSGVRARAFALNYRLMADEGATNAATVGYLLPVVSVALGAIVLNEEITVRIVAGMVVVLTGVGMTQ
jgi:drug/metabolite transporter (DMT)-like permease